jgi:HK97 gp10 family phage protein
MAGIEVQLDTRRLDALIATLVPRARRASEQVARRVEARAKANAPVKTGHLRRSIHAARASADPNAWTVGTDVEYASFVEFGTRRMSPRPYLIPAVEAERARFSDVLSELFR